MAYPVPFVTLLLVVGFCCGIEHTCGGNGFGPFVTPGLLQPLVGFWALGNGERSS
jgi:hypothetical protein